MRGIEPRQRYDYVIEVESGGSLALPAEWLQKLGLAPGDIVALEPLDWALKIRFYRQILTFPWEALSLPIRWSFIVDLLRLPLTALDERGAITIPPKVLRLRAGEKRKLTVEPVFGSFWPSVYLRY